MLQLPRTRGCLVCGRDNLLGFHATSFVDDAGVVRTEFVARAEHIGFEGVLHGGVIATVLDEAMVWAATWSQKRFCLAAELNVRYRSIGEVGRTLVVTAETTSVRSRLVVTRGQVHDGARLVAEGTAKYIPVPAEEHARMCRTFAEDAASLRAADLLRGGV